MEESDTRKKIFTFLFGLLVLLGGLGAGLVLVRQTQNFRQKAAGGSVNLSLIPASTTVSPGQSFTLSISVDPSGNTVSAASVSVSYPQDKLSLEGVDAGPLFMKSFNSTTTAMLNKINTQTAGSASITLGAPCSKQTPWVCYPRNDVDTLAVLRFKALAGGTAPVSFSSQSQIVATGSTSNVLGTTTGASVTITSAAPTSTPSPTTVPTPSATITSIVGWLDGATCDAPNSAGWTTDNRNHAQKLTVNLEIYPDGDKVNKIIRSTTANGYRADLIAAGVCPDGKCAYGLTLGSLPAYFGNKRLRVDVYGIAPDGKNLLSGSGKLIGPCNNLISPPPPVLNSQINGYVDGTSCSWAGGWARDQRNMASKLTIRAEAFPVGDPANVHSVTTLANTVRADLSGVCPPGGACAYYAMWGNFPASFASKQLNVSVWGVAADGATNIIPRGAAPATIGPCTNIKSP